MGKDAKNEPGKKENEYIKKNAGKAGKLIANVTLREQQVYMAKDSAKQRNILFCSDQK